jgi:hypothetical protein
MVKITEKVFKLLKMVCTCVSQKMVKIWTSVHQAWSPSDLVSSKRYFVSLKSAFS